MRHHERVHVFDGSDLCRRVARVRRLVRSLDVSEHHIMAVQRFEAAGHLSRVVVVTPIGDPRDFQKIHSGLFRKTPQ